MRINPISISAKLITGPIQNLFCIIPRPKSMSTLGFFARFISSAVLFWFLYVLVHEAMHYTLACLFGLLPRIEFDLLSGTPAKVIPNYSINLIGSDLLEAGIIAVSPHLLSLALLAAFLRMEKQKYFCPFTPILVIFYDLGMNLLSLFSKQGDFVIVGYAASNLGFEGLGVIMICAFIFATALFAILHGIRFIDFLKKK